MNSSGVNNRGAPAITLVDIFELKVMIGLLDFPRLVVIRITPEPPREGRVTASTVVPKPWGHELIWARTAD